MAAALTRIFPTREQSTTRRRHQRAATNGRILHLHGPVTLRERRFRVASSALDRISTGRKPPPGIVVGPPVHGGLVQGRRADISFIGKWPKPATAMSKGFACAYVDIVNCQTCFPNNPAANRTSEHRSDLPLHVWKLRGRPRWRTTEPRCEMPFAASRTRISGSRY